MPLHFWQEHIRLAFRLCFHAMTLTTEPPDVGSQFNFFHVIEWSLLNHGRTIKITGKNKTEITKIFFSAGFYI